MAVVFEGGGNLKPRHGPLLVLDLPRMRPAGWEREIAAPVLKEVEVVPTLLSDDVHTIGLPPRVTQPSVGRYIKEVKHYRDASSGTHFALYGGVNLLPVFGERMKTVPTVPRTHHHFGTGVNTGFQEVELHPSVLDLKVNAERANWVPPPSAASAHLARLARASRRQQAEHQAIFPFPKDPATSLRRAGGPAGPAGRAGPPDTQTTAADEEEPEVVLPMSSLLWPTPFWYNGSLRRGRRPVGDPNDYSFCKLSKDGDPERIRENLQINLPDYYIPGQIGDERNVPVGMERTSEEVDDAPARVKQPLYKRRVIPIRPPQEYYLVDPWIGQNKQKLHKAGLTFRTDVCRSHYSQFPPGPQPFITLRRNDYPDLTLSTL